VHLAAAEALLVSLRAPGGRITPRRDWYRNFDLPVEAARGLGSRDAHLCVGQADVPLRPGAWCGLVASLRPNPPAGHAAALPASMVQINKNNRLYNRLFIRSLLRIRIG